MSKGLWGPRTPLTHQPWPVGDTQGTPPPPEDRAPQQAECSAYRRGSGANGGGQGAERKNRPAGAEGWAQEKEGPKRPSIYELEKVMIGVFMCVCVCVCWRRGGEVISEIRALWTDRGLIWGRVLGRQARMRMSDALE